MTSYQVSQVYYYPVLRTCHVPGVAISTESLDEVMEPLMVRCPIGDARHPTHGLAGEWRNPVDVAFARDRSGGFEDNDTWEQRRRRARAVSRQVSRTRRCWLG